MTYTFTSDDKQAVIDVIQRNHFKVPHTIIIKPHAPRTGAQNRYLWGVVYSVIGGELGEDTETIHQIMAQKFNSEIIEVAGEEYRVVKTTTKLSTAEFAAYIEKIIQWAWHDLNISIPSADQATEEVFEKIRQQYNKGLQIKNYEEDNQL